MKTKSQRTTPLAAPQGVHVRDCGRLGLGEIVNRRFWVLWVKLGAVRLVG
jgi:hypothetical protein